MDQLSELIDKVIRKRGLQKHVHAAQVVHAAQIWLNENLSHMEGKLRAMRLKDSVLHIEANDSIACQECNSKKEELHEHLQDEGFTDIVSIFIERARSHT